MTLGTGRTRDTGTNETIVPTMWRYSYPRPHHGLKP